MFKNKQTENKSWQTWGILEPCTLLVGIQNGAAAVEDSLIVPEKVKDTITIPSVIPLLGIDTYPKDLITGTQCS